MSKKKYVLRKLELLEKEWNLSFEEKKEIYFSIFRNRKYNSPRVKYLSKTLGEWYDTYRRFYE